MAWARSNENARNGFGVLVAVEYGTTTEARDGLRKAVAEAVSDWHLRYTGMSGSAVISGSLKNLRGDIAHLLHND